MNKICVYNDNIEKELFQEPKKTFLKKYVPYGNAIRLKHSSLIMLSQQSLISILTPFKNLLFGKMLRISGFKTK